MEKEPKNYLDNFDFCLRKTIAIYAFGKNSDDNMTEFANALGTTQPMLSKWLNVATDEKGRITPTMESRHAPNTAQIILASAYLSMPVIEMIDVAIAGEEKKAHPLISAGMLNRMQQLSKELHDKGVAASPKRFEKRTEDYLRKIRRTGNARYIGFFLQDGCVEHLIIETYEPFKTGSVPMTARIIGKAGNPYRGNVVSPPGNDHLYFYIRQEDGKNDRGIMVFYIDDDMQDLYKCGYGILLSTDRKTGKVQLQWVVIIRVDIEKQNNESDTMLALREIQKNEKEINESDRRFERTNEIRLLDQMIKPLLEEQLPEEQENSIQFEDLRMRQKRLYELYQSIYESEMEIAEIKVEYAKRQYEQALSDLEAIKAKAMKS